MAEIGDFERFKEYCLKLEAELEERRNKYKARFKLSLAVSIIAVFLSIFLIAKSSDDAMGFSVITFTLITFALFRYTALTVPRYKEQVRKSGVGAFAFEDKFVFEDLIFSRLLGFFGDFKFKNKTSIPLHEIEVSTIIPEHDLYLGEDYIEGIVNKTRVKIAEAKFIKNIDQKPYDFFRGLLILIDFSNSDIKLREPFRGKSVLINDDKKFSSLIKTKYKDFTTFKLPAAELESKFEAFTTNEAEAQHIFSNNILNAVIELGDFVSSLKNQQHEWDDKLMHYFESSLTRASDNLWAVLTILGNAITSFSRTAKSGYLDSVFDPTKINEASDDVKAANCSIQCAAYDDKFLITIPYSHDLFEVNSLFEKPIIDEDRDLVFKLINAVNTITGELIKTKAA